MFETLHLDLEGGVGERRTAPSKNAAALDEATVQHHAPHTTSTTTPVIVGAAVEVELETKVYSSAGDVARPGNDDAGKQVRTPTSPPVKKAKKRVAFHSDRPELYDF